MLGWPVRSISNMVAKLGYYPGYLVTGNKDLSYFPEMLKDFVYLGIILHDQRLLIVLQEPQQPVRYYCNNRHQPQNWYDGHQPQNW